MSTKTSYNSVRNSESSSSLPRQERKADALPRAKNNINISAKLKSRQ